ncbi:unnamed protein product [Mytilus coruscus]|uniref:DDE Tnp4 domain-containing protein n=1 Tax=Mytilus coruscus TaxID=42192 RepID=A0A6J8EET4_MYTCO|nr:unnamed protein product [Mytilus coruscus]
MLRVSDILTQMRIHMASPQGRIFYIYGDPAYPVTYGYITAPFRGGVISRNQMGFNKRMSAVRICVEWAFGKRTRQLRRRGNSLGDLTDLDIPKKAASLRKSVADRVLEALSSPEVINTIMPILSKQISETLVPIIQTEVKKCVMDEMEPLLHKIDSQNKTIEKQQQQITMQFIQLSALQSTTKDQVTSNKERDNDVNFLYNRVAELEKKLEIQEQYSRRTSLCFNNIPIPVDRLSGGKIVHPVDTDNIILDICKNKLKLDIGIQDIGRSHVIGKVKQGKSQVIVRFISYRTRQLVFSNKKALKGDPNGTFITENLTQFRTNLVKKLAALKFNNKINTYWTMECRIFVKLTANSNKRIINDLQDISDLEAAICQGEDSTNSNNSGD